MRTPVFPPAPAERPRGPHATGRRTAGGARRGPPDGRPVRPASSRRSPAAGAPLRQRGPLGAQRRVLAVARVEPGVVRQPVEQLVLDVVDQGARRCPARRSFADAAGEQRVAGDQVRVAGRVVVQQRDRAGGVADQRRPPPARTWPTRTRSPSSSSTSAGTGSSPASARPAAVRAPVAVTTSASACQWSRCRWVVTTCSRPAVTEQGEQGRGVVRRVDQRPLAGLAALAAGRRCCPSAPPRPW